MNLSLAFERSKQFLMPHVFLRLVELAGIAYIVATTFCLFPLHPGAPLDGDQLELIMNLGKAPSFPEAMRWWTHKWVGGFHYWRPLTCYFFWFELHGFTLRRPELWAWTSRMSQLLVDFLLALLVRQFTGRWIVGILAAVIFTGDPHCYLPRGFWPDAGSTCQIAVTDWKEQDEYWVAAAVLGTMNAALRGRWELATILAAMSPCFKEHGWVAIPFSLALLYLRDQLRAIPRNIVIANLCVIALWLSLRWITGRNVFDIQPVGHNIHWYSRYFSALAGPFLRLMRGGDFADAAMAIVIALTLMLPRLGLSARLALFTVGTLAAALVGAADLHVGVTVAAATLVDPSMQLAPILAGAWWLVLAWALLTDAEHLQVAVLTIAFRIVCSITVAIGLAVGLHTLYMSNAFYCALCALAFDALLRRIAALKGQARA